jgi:hypothetical protein
MADVKTELLLKINLTLGAGERQDMGTTPAGTRVLVPVTGGTCTGPYLQGMVLPGGDWALQRADGVTVLVVRATLRTHDQQLISMTCRGISIIIPEVHQAPEVRQRVWQGETVDPSEYYIRTTPSFETESVQYGWFNRTVAVGVGRPTLTGVAYKVYALR